MSTATADPLAVQHADVLVMGGGISGLSVAHMAARSGHQVTVLEGAAQPGGCLDTRPTGDGFWLELGAHTCYNSYTTLIALLEQSGGLGGIVPRGDARKRFGRLADGRLQVLTPLSVFGQFRLAELLAALPKGLWARRPDDSMQVRFSRLLGAGNYARVLGPFLAAVPSQTADAFPAEGAGALFKRRARRRDVTKSWTLQQGLGSAVAQLAATPGIRLCCDRQVVSVSEDAGLWCVETESGEAWQTPRLALAVPPDMAASLLATARPQLAACLAQIAMASVDSVGVVVARDVVRVPPLAFIVPTDDVFYSAVTRDPLPHEQFRAFTFHFRPGLGEGAQLARMAAVLQCAESDFQVIHRRHRRLPSPRVGHGAIVDAIDALLAGDSLALCGNYFQGLAIEDCVARACSEWRRLEPQLAGPVAAIP